MWPSTLLLPGAFEASLLGQCRQSNAQSLQAGCVNFPSFLQPTTQLPLALVYLSQSRSKQASIRLFASVGLMWAWPANACSLEVHSTCPNFRWKMPSAFVSPLMLPDKCNVLLAPPSAQLMAAIESARGECRNSLRGRTHTALIYVQVHASSTRYPSHRISIITVPSHHSSTRTPMLPSAANTWHSAQHLQACMSAKGHTKTPR